MCGLSSLRKFINKKIYYIEAHGEENRRFLATFINKWHNDKTQSYMITSKVFVFPIIALINLDFFFFKIKFQNG